MYPLFCDNPDDTRYDLDPTPKASTGAHFRFTPSLLDPNSTAFATFAAQPPGYYTPTPGISTLGPHSYGLGTTTETFNTSDALSHPTPNALATPSIFDPRFGIDSAHYMHLRPHPYTGDNYHGMSVPGSAVGAVGSESPHSNYSPETGSGAETTDHEVFLANGFHGKFMNPGVTPSPDIYGQHIPNAMARNLPCRFRFATTLHAATAMLRHSSDIPVTYLNKRQAYTISVVDNSPAVQNNEIKRYRTIVRIAFDEEEQRRTAPACWRLWKDGRGTLESGGNPDKLRAIDYGKYPFKYKLILEPVETRAVNDKKSNSETSFQIEESSTSFDRFTITWFSTSSTPSVYFCVRFLFLSTDFSHSKGVKGVPVRLVAKTEFLGTGDSAFQGPVASELSYCKIKLFRDKGAERKLANDRQHLERAIEKLRQQAQQLTMDTSDASQPVTNRKKKRHSVSGVSMTESYMISPQRRHRRDWSISSNASSLSAGANPRSQQDEVQRKLDKAMIMDSMFSSIRPTSVFSLAGDPADDPSLPLSPIAPQSQWEAPGMGVTFAAETTVTNAQRGSPAMSQTSFSSHTSEKVAYAATSPLVHPVSPTNGTTRMTGITSPSRMSQRTHVQAATRDIEAIGVDPYYVPLPAPTIRPGINLLKICY